MNDLKWKVKLTGGFLILSCLVGLVGYLGVRNLSIINNNGRLIYSENLMLIKDLNQIRTTFLKNRSSIILFVYATDKIKQQDLKHQIAIDSEINNKNEQNYEKDLGNKLIVSETQFYNDFKNSQVDYRNKRESMIQKLEAGNITETAVFLDQVLEANDKALISLNNLITSNEEEASQRQASNQRVYQRTLEVMLGLIGLGIILALIIGLYLSQNLTRRLGNIVRMAKAFGDGDLTWQQTIYGKDEIGQMGLSINKAMGNMREMVNQMLISTKP